MIVFGRGTTSSEQHPNNIVPDNHLMNSLC